MDRAGLFIMTVAFAVLIGDLLSGLTIFCLMKADVLEYGPPYPALWIGIVVGIAIFAVGFAITIAGMLRHD